MSRQEGARAFPRGVRDGGRYCSAPEDGARESLRLSHGSCRQPHNVSEWSLNHKLHVGAAYELSSSDVAGVMHVCAPSLQVRFVV